MGVYKVIGRDGKEIFTDVLLHPAEVLAEELKARRISRKTFASSVNISASRLNEFFKFKRPVSASLANKLERSLGIDAGFWLRLQADYDLTVMRKKIKTA